jgi:molecular chaperone IbpA
MTMTPLLRQSVGFDRFNDLFESLLSDTGEQHFENYPPYNIEKLSEDSYRITMAVAGFTMDDLNIVMHGDTLSVHGRVADKSDEEQREYLHRGIATRSFERSFRLADYIKVQDASLKDGLLTIDLIREIPEEEKPRMIPINNGGSNGNSIEGRKSKKS